MARRVDIYVDTDHDDDAEARKYVESILSWFKDGATHDIPGDPHVLHVETREVSEVDYSGAEEPDVDTG